MEITRTHKDVKHPMLKRGVVYAITINPDDKHQYYKVPDPLVQVWKERLEAFQKSWKTTFYKMFDMYETTYNMRIEISEPLDGSDAVPRLHFHGIIRFDTDNAIMEFLLVNLRALKTMSRVKIKPIDDIEIWYNYCMKQSYLPLGYLHHGLNWTLEEKCKSEEEIELIIPEGKKGGSRIREPRQGGKGSRARVLPSRSTNKRT